MSSWLAFYGDAAQRFAHVNVVIGDLAGDRLGWAYGSTIVIDRDAAGHGWYVDSTPADSAEFSAAAIDGMHALAGSAAKGMDLLTVMTHELGHILGLGDVEDSVAPASLMAESLATGVRRVIDKESLDAVFSGD